jgi:cellobiose-specific phosphotransferase system component IIB
MEIPKPGNESASLPTVVEDWSLTGANTELLSVRISKGLHRELAAIAKRSRRQLPEVIREMLWFHAFPSDVKNRLEEIRAQGGKPGTGSTDITLLLGLVPQISMYQRQMEKLLDECAQVKVIEERAHVLQAELMELQGIAKAKWQTFLEDALVPEIDGENLGANPQIS